MSLLWVSAAPPLVKALSSHGETTLAAAMSTACVASKSAFGTVLILWWAWAVAFILITSCYGSSFILAAVVYSPQASLRCSCSRAPTAISPRPGGASFS